MVEFRKANLRESFKSLGLFDLILCRNVLIYFADPLKRQICEGFFQSLLPGGFLMLGAAESLFGINELFQTDRQGETLVYCRPAN
jgi:chemotaxis protein methyltransferase CheR